MLREYKVGLKEVEVIHSVLTVIVQDDGKKVEMHKVTVIIPDVSEDALTAYTLFPLKRGKHKLEVFIAPKSKTELKLRLREIQTLKSEVKPAA